MNKDYKKYADRHAPKSPLLKDCVWAFVVGGLICVGSQGLHDLYGIWLEDETASTLVSVTLVFLAALTTGLGWFDMLAHHAGAGTLVPITGFANAVASCAIDSKSEGIVLGMGAKIFAVAGPVILYGVLSSALYGVIYWICLLCGAA